MKNEQMQHELAQLGNGAHALAIQILGNADDAADAVHDAFAKALSRPDAYNADKGPLKPWFMYVVRNRCIDLLRSRRPGDEDVTGLQHPGFGPEASLEVAQRDRQLRMALANLSAGHREIIVLRDYMDLSYAEIASVLEIAHGTMMSRLHRARLVLKEDIQRDD